ncbi:hypothetical protein lerEdw1_007583 [Lerista edwardsae]|nr:hypothetical protein lerEdw1_007583 [Lerista edwardsae]
MSENSLPHKGLVQPHVHYSFLKTAAEGLSLSEDDFQAPVRDSPESDSESLAQEIQYQVELQKRVCKREELVKQNDALESESFEEDSLEEEGLGEDGEVEEMQIPSGRNCGKENCSNESNEQDVTDQYAELRYNPNWKANKGGVAFSELKASLQDDDQSSPVLSLSSTCSSPQLEFVVKNQQPQDPTQNTVFDEETPGQPTSVGDPSYPLPENRGEHGRKLGAAGHSSSASSLCSDWSSDQNRTCRGHRSERDFVEKNKLTLGLSVPPRNSYLHLHGKRQREGPQRQARSCPGLQAGRTSSSPCTSLRENSVSGSSLQHSLGSHGEPRSLHGRPHNALEPENPCVSSACCGEAADFEKDSRHLGHRGPYANPAVAPSGTSTINHSTIGWDAQFHRDPDCAVHQDDPQTPMCLTVARNPLQPSSYENFPDFHLPRANDKGKRYPRGPQDAPGHEQGPRRCAVSKSLSGSCQNVLRHKPFSHSDNAGLQQAVYAKLSSQSLKTPSSSVSGTSRPPQALACNPIRAPSPNAQLIQAAERHHQQLSQLAGDHLASSQFAGVLPPIVQRGESDPQLHMEGSKGGQSILSRWNSEGYLLQREKQKARKEKENNKSEKIRQQKEYARRVQERNMANLANVRKQLPTRPDNKLPQSRQKALEYAKMIPKPKPAPSRPSEQEAADEKGLAHALSRENLPPISSLESLQDRHEKEKQVVAAFRTLHIP